MAVAVGRMQFYLWVRGRACSSLASQLRQHRVLSAGSVQVSGTCLLESLSPKVSQKLIHSNVESVTPDPRPLAGRVPAQWSTLDRGLSHKASRSLGETPIFTSHPPGSSATAIAK